MPAIVHTPDMPYELTPRAYTRQPDGNEYSIDVEPVSVDEATSMAPKPLSGLAREVADRESLRDVPMGSGERQNRSAIRLRDYQIEAIEAVEDAWARGKNAPLVVLPTGCHRAGQLVLAFDGSLKRVEDVQVGDLLMGPDSTPRTVLALCRGIGPMIEIIPVKGTPWVVNDEHVLTVRKIAACARPTYPSEEEVELDLSVKEYETKSRYFKHLAKLFRVPVEFQPLPVDLPLEAYFLGLYIADGTCALRRAEISKPDLEVRLECEHQARLHGLTVVDRNTRPDGCPTWAMIGARGSANPIIDKLSALGLMPLKSEERFIPRAYKLGSRETRLALLAGLLDGDGHLGNKTIDYISKSRQLSADATFVARSLGFAAYMSETTKACQNGFSGVYWRVSISGDLSALPMRIERKRASEREQIKSVLHTGFTTRRTGTEEPYFGFALNGDHRYLLDDFTVTHNSGKTIVAAELISRFCEANPTKKAMFIAHRDELLTQTRGKLMVVNDSISVGVVQGSSNQLGRRVTVASVQTVGHHTGRRITEVMNAGQVGLLIIDEAHHATAPGYQRVIERLKEGDPSLAIMGLTATPDRADGTALDSVFDTVAYVRDIFWMIEHGYLVPPTGVTVQLDIDLDSITTREGEFVNSQLSKLMNQPPVNFAVVRAWQEHGFDRKMLAFCVDVAHSESLAEAFRDAGYPAAAIHGEMGKKDRDRVLDDFRKGALKILANCEILTEGYDDPSCEGIIMARPTQSRGLFAQAVGRGLRLYPGKTECIVIDVVGNSDKHSLASLASLAGLEALGAADDSDSGEPKDPGEEIFDEDAEQPNVNDVRASQVRELDFQRLARRRQLRYAWRETSIGWTLQIPRVGYFLVAWADQAHTKCTVHFYDMREGRRDQPPVHILSNPVDFDLAYGMVEGELERFLRARASRNNPQWGNRGNEEPAEDDPSAQASIFAWIDLDDGLSEDIFVAEAMMMNDAGWRRQPITAKQDQLLRKLGAKGTTMPQTAGEAADLITVLQVEHDYKMRLPPTPKQLGYLRYNKIPFTRELTKMGAARLIVEHRRATGTRS
jgi:superfamily II DNA or RNA helicase